MLAGCLEGGRRIGNVGGDGALVDTSGPLPDTAAGADTAVIGDTAVNVDTYRPDTWVPVDTLVADTAGPVDTPCLSMTPAVVTFGTVEAGMSAGENLIVVNCGTTRLDGVTLTFGDPSVTAFSVDGPTSLSLAPGEGRPIYVRFAPSPDEANAGCKASEVTATRQRLLATAGSLTAVTELAGTATAPVTEESCGLTLTVTTPQPATAEEPIELELAANPGLCVNHWSVHNWGATHGAYGAGVGGQSGPLASFLPPDAGFYTFVGQANTTLQPYTECPDVEVVVEVQPVAGFVAKLSWTHPGTTGEDPLADARLELHIARLGAADTPPWQSTLWDTWPDWSPQQFDDTEVNAWPSEATSGYGRVEYAQVGQRFQIGVAARVWDAPPGTAHPVPADATLELWVRGQRVYQRHATVEPGALANMARFIWSPPNGQLYTVQPGPDAQL